MIPIYTLWSGINRERTQRQFMDWKKTIFKPAPTTEPAAPPSPLANRLRSLTMNQQVGGAVAVATADPEFTTELVDELAKGTQPGYQQFMEQGDLLKGVVPDDGMRLKTALASTAKFLNLTPEQIVASIQEKIDLLNRANESFQASLRAEVEQRTTTYTRHLADVDTKLAANQLERERLTMDRNDTQRQLTDIQAETQAVQARFSGAFQPLHDQIMATLRRLR